MFSLLAIASLISLALALPRATPSGDCVGTISSLDDVSAAVQCKTVKIHGFTVPAGRTFSLDLLRGTTVNVLGNMQFGNASWAGPLLQITGEDITFNGNNHRWDGGGPFYWDGKGGSGGVTKPNPMMNIRMSGTLSNIYVVNSPQRCFAVNNIGPLVISGATVDDSQGNYRNEKSNGHSAGRNTDGFDISGNDVVVQNCAVFNQDDCLTINRGSNITVKNMDCIDGHGLSIGSINSNTVVENVVFQDNRVVDSTQAFRIKTITDATKSRVSNITYIGNTAKNCTQFGIVITQSYPKNVGRPGKGVQISGISFSQHQTNVEVVRGAKTVVVNCGAGSCTDWDLSQLRMSGGEAGVMKNYPSLNNDSL